MFDLVRRPERGAGLFSLRFGGSQESRALFRTAGLSQHGSDTFQALGNPGAISRFKLDAECLAKQGERPALVPPRALHIAEVMKQARDLIAVAHTPI